VRSRWDWAVLAGWVAALVAVRSARLTEHDPYWQAREGSERWSGTALSRPDSWSWAQPEGLFRPTSPAWNTALGLGHDAWGLVGIAVVGALGMLAYFAVATLVARRLGARPLPILVATAGAAALALPMVSPRATIVVEALLLATLALGHVLVTRPLPRTWPTHVGTALAAAVLGWAGAWLHVSWAVTALGLAVTLPLLAALAGVPRWRIGLAGTAGLALAVGSLLGPYGRSVWQLLLDISSASDGQIIEWLTPLTPGLRARWIPVAVLCLALAGACAWRLARHRRGAPGSRARAQWALEVVLVATSLAAAVAGVVAIRFLGIAALTLLPVLAAELSTATVRWRSGPQRSEAFRHRLTAGYWRPIVIGVLVLLAPLAVITAHSPGRPLPEADLVGDLPRGCRLFATPDAAGAVLLLRPDVKVWVDMRTEVHGGRAYADTRRRLGDLTDVSLPPGTTCAMLPLGTKAVGVEGSSAPWSPRTPLGSMAVWLPGSQA